MNAEAYGVWTADAERVTGYEMLGSSRSMFANMVSYCFDFKGLHCDSHIARWRGSATVIRTTLKVNGKAWNLTPNQKTRKPVVIEICMSDCVPDTYHGAKFHCDPIREFCFSPAVAYRKFTRLLVWVLPTHYLKGPLCPFSCSIRQKTSFRATMCLLGSSDNEILHLTPFSAKKRK